ETAFVCVVSVDKTFHDDAPSCWVGSCIAFWVWGLCQPDHGFVCLLGCWATPIIWSLDLVGGQRLLARGDGFWYLVGGDTHGRLLCSVVRLRWASWFLFFPGGYWLP